MTKSELARAYLEKASKRRRVLEVDADRAIIDALYAFEAARQLIEGRHAR